MLQETEFWQEISKVYNTPDIVESWKIELSPMFIGMTIEQSGNAAEKIIHMNRKSIPSFAVVKGILAEARAGKSGVDGLPLNDIQVAEGVFMKCPEPDKNGVRQRLKFPYFIRHETEQFRAWNANRIKNEGRGYSKINSDAFKCSGWWFPAEWPEQDVKQLTSKYQPMRASA